eukprot:CAMPEP_0115844624 /NCGR_PEP_ID=MMETSP0287-20121206/8924_1 /TAXON_ID=412157 /ORGANISM="Chrysochromulina rotalis, Strain UIO044" /LENGTH=91 /DNA_ID=CAMNT_0003298355 /DNA_START=471 /DNA_END=746 /DNA_ORIENTATION=+
MLRHASRTVEAEITMHLSTSSGYLTEAARQADTASCIAAHALRCVCAAPLKRNSRGRRGSIEAEWSCGAQHFTSSRTHMESVTATITGCNE